MKIAIIDDGVNVECFQNVKKLEFDLKVNSQNKIVKHIHNHKSEKSHGTICASIIRKYAPTSEIGSIKVISDETMRGEAKHLIAALKWCIMHKIKIIHMSIGSCEIIDITPITELVDKLLNENCIIIAALTNTMKFSVPACLDGVFGVRTNLNLVEDEFSAVKCGIYDVPFVASSKHTLIEVNGSEYQTLQCNSYAAPLITAKAYNVYESHSLLSVREIQAMLGYDVWTTDETRIKNTQFLLEDVEVPIIFVIGSEQKALWATKQLNDIFLKSGYPSKMFATQNYKDRKVNDNIIEIPVDIPAKKFLAFFVSRLNLSVVLIATEHSKHIGILPDAIVYISLEVKCNKYDGDNIYIPYDFNKGNLLRIVKYFEKENS